MGVLAAEEDAVKYIGFVEDHASTTDVHDWYVGRFFERPYKDPAKRPPSSDGDYRYHDGRVIFIPTQRKPS